MYQCVCKLREQIPPHAVVVGGWVAATLWL